MYPSDAGGETEYQHVVLILRHVTRRNVGLGVILLCSVSILMTPRVHRAR